MRSYELQPTDENLMDTYLNDTIGRNEDIYRFIQILNSTEDRCSIAIDGAWGSGKTFFVRQSKLVLDAYNPFIQQDNETKGKIKNIIQAKHSKNPPEWQSQVSVYYDAWDNDNDDDPILSIVYCILQSINTDYSLHENTDVLTYAASILEFFTDKKWGQLIDTLKGSNPLQSIKVSNSIRQQISDFLDSLLAERGDRLVIFIDELDRCKPTFAVRLLERIKHYFNNDRITFVFSTNLNEIQHTIKQYYGTSYNASRYLDRFFDLQITLPPVDLKQYYRYLGFDDRYYLYDIVCSAVIRCYHFQLREITKYLYTAKIAASKPTRDNSHYNFAFPDGKGILFCLMYVVPIIIGLKLIDANRYDDFIHGKDASPMIEVSRFLDSHSFRQLLSDSESYSGGMSEKSVVTVDTKLNELYDLLFIRQYNSNQYEGQIGSCSINNETKETVIKTATLLSEYADLGTEK